MCRFLKLQIQFLPLLRQVELDYGTGSIIITASETIKASSVNTSRISLFNDTFQKISIASAGVYPIDSPSIRVILSEEERAKAVQFSGTPGGDGEGVTIDILYNTLQDMANNPIAAATGLKVDEIPDKIHPYFLSLIVDLNDGMVSLKASETIDVNPITLVNTSKFFFELENKILPTA